MDSAWTELLTKTTTTGLPVEVGFDGKQLVATVNGEDMGDCGILPMALSQPRVINGAKITHFAGKVGLTAAEAATIQRGVEAAWEESRKSYAASPEGIAANERMAVDRLFGEARRHIDDPGEYFPLLADAKEALNAWREKYPSAARAEDVQRLLSDAADLKAKAVGALVYDADGWLSRDDQQKRHDDWMAEAQTKLDEAEALAENAHKDRIVS